MKYLHHCSASFAVSTMWPTGIDISNANMKLPEESPHPNEYQVRAEFLLQTTRCSSVFLGPEKEQLLAVPEDRFAADTVRIEAVVRTAVVAAAAEEQSGSAGPVRTAAEPPGHTEAAAVDSPAERPGAAAVGTEERIEAAEGEAVL